jgi:hypothetical protein
LKQTAETFCHPQAPLLGLLASKRFNPQQIYEKHCQTNRAGGVLNGGLETLSNREMKPWPGV